MWVVKMIVRPPYAHRAASSLRGSLGFSWLASSASPPRPPAWSARPPSGQPGYIILAIVKIHNHKYIITSVIMIIMIIAM